MKVPIKLSPLQLLWVLDLLLKDGGTRTIYGTWERDHPLVMTGIATITLDNRSTTVTLTDAGKRMCNDMLKAGTAFLDEMHKTEKALVDATTSA